MISDVGVLSIVRNINDRVVDLERTGSDDSVLYVELSDQIPCVDYLVDRVGAPGLDELRGRFIGFNRYIQLLESLAVRIESGEIDPPKWLM